MLLLDAIIDDNEKCKMSLLPIKCTSSLVFFSRVRLFKILIDENKIAAWLKLWLPNKTYTCAHGE